MPGISPNARALLDTIRKAEGTWTDGTQKGYGVMFGGGTFDWRKGHPDQVVRSGGYASAAAGAYQFMPPTWEGVRKKLGLRDFSPASQDAAALELIRQRGVNPDDPLSAGMLAKLAPEWASLPNAAGQSAYGQPVKRRDELMQFWKQRVGAAGGTGAVASTPPVAPRAPAGDALEFSPSQPSSVAGRPVGTMATLGGRPVAWDGGQWLAADAMRRQADAANRETLRLSQEMVSPPQRTANRPQRRPQGTAFGDMLSGIGPALMGLILGR